MKEFILLNSGKAMALCTCSADCRSRFVIGEMCLTQGEGYLIKPSSSEKKDSDSLLGFDIVSILRTSEEIIFTTEEEKQAVPPAVLVAIYFDEKVKNDKYAGYFIFASNKNPSEDFSNDQKFDFWLLPAKDHSAIKSAKRLGETPDILGDHVAFKKVGETKIYF